jgi:hypothetical protein
VSSTNQSPIAAPSPCQEEAQQLLSLVSALRSKLLKAQSALATFKRGEKKTVEQCMELVGTGEGRLNLEQVLAKTPFPHYQAVPGEAGVLIRIEADGSRSRGEFVGRTFHPLVSV